MLEMLLLYVTTVRIITVLKIRNVELLMRPRVQRSRVLVINRLVLHVSTLLYCEYCVSCVPYPHLPLQSLIRVSYQNCPCPFTVVACKA